MDRAAAVGNLAAHRRVPVDAAEASSQEAVGRWVSPLVPVEPQKAVHVKARGVAGQAEEAFRALAGLVAADALQVVEAREAVEVLQMVADREAEAPEAAEAGACHHPAEGPGSSTESPAQYATWGRFRFRCRGPGRCYRCRSCESR